MTSRLPALHWQILIALALAVIAGRLTAALGPETESFENLTGAYDFVGTLFLNGLKMLIVPLIVTSIIAGMLSITGQTGGNLGRLSLKTVSYYVLTSLSAVVVGLLVVNLIQPGLVDGVPGADKLGFEAIDTQAVDEKVAGRSASDITAVFLRMVPTNIVAAAAEGQMLGLIFFSLLVGYFITKLMHERQHVQKTFWEGSQEVMMGITQFIMRFAPIGVFGLVADVTAGFAGNEEVWQMFRSLSVFAITVLIALGIHMFIVLPLLLKFVGRVSPFRHFQAMSPALLTAFSTASSSATLPVTMDSVQDRAGVSKQTSGFVLPLGATINMDGTALYECVVVMFIAQAYGLELSIAQQATVVILALVTSIGVAGIPSASLVAIALILGTFGLPLEAVAAILVFDRVLDMCRTAVNVFGDSSGAVIVARSEGEDNVLGEPAR